MLARVCGEAGAAARSSSFKGRAYASPAQRLQALAQVVKKKGLRVDRVVRVACPARGTLLASKRLDAYLSVFKWTLELAGVPVAPELVDFLGAGGAAARRPEEIPGLAAQIPDSPLVQWLHAVDEAIPGELRVVAGDMQGDSVVSWLKTLLADAFYWTDNDLVVQTRSMYGGAPRASGRDASCSTRAARSRTSTTSPTSAPPAAIVERAAAGRAAGLPRDRPAVVGRRVVDRRRAARRATLARRRSGDKPAVFLLPGILGSNLKVDGKRIWLGWRLVNGLQAARYDPATPTTSSPTARSSRSTTTWATSSRPPTR